MGLPVTQVGGSALTGREMVNTSEHVVRNAPLVPLLVPGSDHGENWGPSLEAISLHLTEFRTPITKIRMKGANHVSFRCDSLDSAQSIAGNSESRSGISS